MSFTSYPYNPPNYSTPEVLYEDASLLIVNKLPGLLTVPGRGPERQDCLIARVQQIVPEALIVHRLDMATLRRCSVGPQQICTQRVEYSFSKTGCEKALCGCSQQ